MTSANFALSTEPVKVITPSATDTVIPVMFFFLRASLTVPSSILSGDGGGGANTYTVESGDSLSKIGGKYGIPWKAIWDANRDILHDPDKIYPGQELKIP